MSSKTLRRGLAMAAGLALFGFAAEAAPQASGKGACDRACLIATTDQYLAALVAHDPAKAPLAPNLVFVENLKRMKPGEGLWKTAAGGPAAFRIYCPT